MAHQQITDFTRFISLAVSENHGALRKKSENHGTLRKKK